MKPASMKHTLSSWQQERRSAYLYRIIAQAEPMPPRRELFERAGLDLQRILNGPG